MIADRSATLVTADHRHVARRIAAAFALTSSEGISAYAALRPVLALCLTSSERQGLAWAALGACTPDQAEGIAMDLFEIDQPSGSPIPPLDPDDATVEAQLWVEGASDPERLAYATAILQRLSADDQARVLRAASVSQPC